MLIIGTLIVIISALITLNIFFQQSLQMEVAEQFNKHQLLLSTSTANSIKSYFYFLREEIVELARELSEKDVETETAFDKVITNELKHKRLIKTNVGILDARGAILFYRGDKEIIRQLALHAVKEAGNIKPLDAKIVERQPMITVIAPVYKNGKLARIVLFSSEIQNIANHLFMDLKAGTKWYAWMMDKDGNLLYHPTQPEMVGRNLYKADATCFKCHISFDLEKRIVEGKAANYGRYIAASGEDKIIAFSTADIGGSISWVIAVSSPYSEVTYATRQSMKLYSWLIISIFITTSVVSTLLIIFNKKRIQAEEVAKRKQELEKYAVELENKVIERTTELASEKEKLDTIVSAIGGGIILIDKKGKIQWGNQMIKNMAGMELIGKPCEEVCPDCAISESYAKDNIDTAILSNLFGQRDKYFQITTAPVKGEDGEIHGYIRLIQDVTEMKKMEEQIIHSEKLASIGRLAAGIAHEIGNPLTSIFSFVQILREMEQDAFKKESLETIYFHINRISEILKQLSGFSRMPAGELRKCHINEIIETSINLIQYDKKAKNISIVKELSPELPEVACDGNMLSQVFVNLTLNAIDAMPDVGTLTVRSLIKGEGIVIQFGDTGMGISKEDLKRIFDPFYTTKEKGTGLGLAVSYDIIKKMNGTLTVESEAGKGSVFTITIPAVS
ncbi:MAG: sensor histidine kinase [Nitrospirae bacterium]|nr:MAG: sensor histidine kinase [Nitrospirota bacterium]